MNTPKKHNSKLNLKKQTITKLNDEQLNAVAAASSTWLVGVTIAVSSGHCGEGIRDAITV